MTDNSLYHLCNTTNASIWAEEFIKLHPEMDEGEMITWFANAIETAKQEERDAIAERFMQIFRSPR